MPQTTYFHKFEPHTLTKHAVLDAYLKMRAAILARKFGQVWFVDVFAGEGWQAVGDGKLKVIASELITQMKKGVTIDWTLRESVRAKIKVMVKRILKNHGYPPDLQDETAKTVLAQAELLCTE